jgi:hypothetical protein
MEPDEMSGGRRMDGNSICGAAQVRSGQAREGGRRKGGREVEVGWIGLAVWTH